MRKIILAVIAVFIAWSAIDFVIHGLILRASYAATAPLWRPMAEMKFLVLHIAVLIAALTFVLIYALLVSSRGISTGVRYGVLFGVGTGVSMGYGTYAVMPIPYAMAFTWFLGSVVEAVVGGLILGLLIRD